MRMKKYGHEHIHIHPNTSSPLCLIVFMLVVSYQLVRGRLVILACIMQGHFGNEMLFPDHEVKM